jgi:predicted 3-demethylubiquinone-9 3-methyltransferase (glyoxalase superfamily)
MPTLTTFLMYDNQAEAAVRHYVSVFEGGRIVSTMPGPGGSVMGLTFEILGQRLIAVNGGPSFQFTSGISLFVGCKTQEEIDRYWTKLLQHGGKESRCGWLVDGFGVSWQLIPDELGSMLGDPDRDKAGRAMQAMLKMGKLDLAELRRAHAGR